MSLLFNEYAGFKVFPVYGRFMGVLLQFVNKTRLHCHIAKCTLSV